MKTQQETAVIRVRRGNILTGSFLGTTKPFYLQSMGPTIIYLKFTVTRRFLEELHINDVMVSFLSLQEGTFTKFCMTKGGGGV